MAIVHIAMFDVVNAMVLRYRSYAAHLVVVSDTSMDAAIAQAAHDKLAALFPSQKPRFKTLLDEDLARIKNARGRARGIDLGKQSAAAILALRDNDGSNHAGPRLGADFFTGNNPGGR